ncbi:MAG: hypothetical protein OEX07_02900 [Gammaproteobacteria bacterium]|nr:hypothetical protein [Gammaproteobacteria bacterium]
MKKNILSSAIGASLVLLAGSALADTSNDATAKVYVQVSPNVSVVFTDAHVDLGTVQTGKFGGTATFRVDANEEAVILGVTATNLYKGDVCVVDPEVAPLPVNGDGALVEPDQANPFNSFSKMLPWVTEAEHMGCLGSRSSDVPYESAQNGHFSQDVDVSVSWDQPDPEQPQGEYSGFIILHTMLLGEG